MINASLENNFGIVRKVIDWSLGWEMYATEHGQPPTDEQLADAEQVGVAHPEKIRFITLPHLPSPLDDVAADEANGVNALTRFSQKWSYALGYGVLTKDVEWDNRENVLLSLAHVALCERLGGAESYVRQYVTELLTLGFFNSPLEHRAQAAASRAAHLTHAHQAFVKY